MFLKTKTLRYTENFWDKVKLIRTAINNADALVIGAGAGLSAAAGFSYTGKRFEDNFGDFIEKYGFRDMYSAGFYPFESLEEYWAYWSRYIFINRYQNPLGDVYDRLLELVKDKNYFVLTTNVDHCFQKAGFDKNRLFYTQGDYGLWQCSVPCHSKTYDNEDIVRKMVSEQKDMKIPTGLIPRCPVCGAPMTMNLRVDDTFVEDDGWHEAAKRYMEFIKKCQRKRTLYFELGVGGNTPTIIKYPFWQMTYQNPEAFYASVNYGEAYAPKEIMERSICIDGDIGNLLKKLKRSQNDDK